MKKIITLLFLGASHAFAQYLTPTAGALYIGNVNPSITAVDYSFPPTPATGAGIVMYDATFGGPVCAILGSGLSYNSGTETISVSQTARSTSTGVSRSLASSFQVSTTRDSLVSYTVSSTVTLSLSGGQSTTVNLQISPNGSTWTTVGTFTNGNTGSLVVGLSVAQALTQQLTAYVPAGYYVQLAYSGSTTPTYDTGQETLL